jgi:hypothetical protein
MRSTLKWIRYWFHILIYNWKEHQNAIYIRRGSGNG